MNSPLPRPVAMLTALLLAAPARAQAPTPVWMDRYDGSASLQDETVQVALGAGGLFVLGRSTAASGSDDFTLLKYTPHGSLAWVRSYDGPGHSQDRASAMLPDGEGGAFVCGYSWGGLGWQAALLHYDGDGNVLWVRSVATPGVIDLELGPRIARTPGGGLRMGMTAHGDFLVAAFDGVGTPLWTRAIDVVAGADDFLTGLAVDSAGNTVVVGPVGGGFGGYETVKLDAGGTLAWIDGELGDLGSTLGPAFVAIEEGGEIVVSGVPESSCGVLQTRTWRYTPGGVRLWTRAFPPLACDSAETVDMALDGDGNALVLCSSTISGEGSWADFTVLKYSPDGLELWRRSLAHVGVDIPTALDVDPAGNVYLAGSAGLAHNRYDGLAASYAPDGSLRWTRLFDGEAPGDRPADIAAGPRGEVYLSGAAFFQDTSEDILTVKLQPSPRFAVPR